MKLLKDFVDKFAELENNDDWRKRYDLEFALGKVKAATRAYRINVTGDVCRGDNILFVRRIWDKIRVGRRMVNAVVGYELVEAEVLRESYGSKTAQHTFFF